MFKCKNIVYFYVWIYLNYIEVFFDVNFKFVLIKNFKYVKDVWGLKYYYFYFFIFCFK